MMNQNIRYKKPNRQFDILVLLSYEIVIILAALASKKSNHCRHNLWTVKRAQLVCAIQVIIRARTAAHRWNSLGCISKPERHAANILLTRT